MRVYLRLRPGGSTRASAVRCQSRPSRFAAARCGSAVRAARASASGFARRQVRPRLLLYHLGHANFALGTRFAQAISRRISIDSACRASCHWHRPRWLASTLWLQIIDKRGFAVDAPRNRSDVCATISNEALLEDNARFSGSTLRLALDEGSRARD